MKMLLAICNHCICFFCDLHASLWAYIVNLLEVIRT